MNSSTNFKLWLENEYFDKETRDELSKIKDNPTEIEERFYKDLEFGTGGLRGIIGAGTNRINIYTIRKASQGLASYIKILYQKRSILFLMIQSIKENLTGPSAQIFIPLI